jgi:hypothetical protein
MWLVVVVPPGHDLGTKRKKARGVQRFDVAVAKQDVKAKIVAALVLPIV